MLYVRRTETRRHYIPTIFTLSAIAAIISGGTWLSGTSDRITVGASHAKAAVSPYHLKIGRAPFDDGAALGRQVIGGPGHGWGKLDGGDEPAARKPALSAREQIPHRREQVVVRRGDTLMDILLRAGVGRAEAHEAVNSLQEIYDPRKLRVGQMLNIEFQQDEPKTELLSSLSINLDFRNDIKVERLDGGDFDVEQVERALVQENHFASARVDGSLYLAGRRAGVPDDAIMEMIRLFSWDVDFQRDIQPGDSFEIVYGTLSDAQGDQTRLENISYAKVSVGGTELTAYRFVHEDGRVGYYDKDGQSLRKWLMRTPIDGARMSSGFGKRRHPILGYTRMHKGIDFAAPTGTPIYAAGDGTIARAGRKGTYGNYVQIRHNAEYSTAYAHLSKFAKGLRAGDRVKQGEVIGYVGTTGRSTGPHLHYEVIQNGEPINPLKIKPQKAVVLAGSELKAFEKERERVAVYREANKGIALR